MSIHSYIKGHVEKTRDSMKSDSFSNIGKLSIELRGKPVSSVLSVLSDHTGAILEVIDPTLAAVDAVEYADGEIVDAERAFSISDPIVWVGKRLYFKTADGGIVTPEEYRYLQENTLVDRAVFGSVSASDFEMRPDAAFKRMVRAAAEAKSDKAKDIFYLTVGIAHWGDKRKRSEDKKPKICHAPLFVMHVQAGGSGMSVKAAQGGVIFSPNRVLFSEIERQYSVDVCKALGKNDYYGPSEVLEAIDKVAECLEKELGASVRIEKDKMYLTLLDSQLEAICQKIEENIESIAASPLAALLSGEPLKNAEAAPTAKDTTPIIYPLSADESQRAVIAASLAGNSVFASAPAGTGKSQTAVNIAANTVLRGGRVFVLSEKLAANDVFLNYSERVGLAPFCLTIDNDMSIKELIRKVERVAELKARYVKPDEARSTVKSFHRAEYAYERLNSRLYAPIRALGGASLYDLIAIAAEYPALSHGEGLSVSETLYTAVLSLLDELDVGLLSQMTDGEYDAYFLGKGENDDGELERLLDEISQKLLKNGVNCKELFAKNGLSRLEAVGQIKSQLARGFALHYVDEWQLADVGERSVRKIYKELYDSARKMEGLYRDLLTQTLTARAKESPTSELIARLKDADKARIPVSKCIQEYADLLREVFPIIVSTPVPAVNYLYGTGLDSFTLMSVDEASQMPIVAILPFLDRVERLVVFGDEKQLAIINIGKKKIDGGETFEEKIEEAKESVLDAVRGKDGTEGFFAGALRYHYRSKTEMLVHVSNELCYNSSLQVVPDVATSRHHLKDGLGLSLVKVDPPPQPPKGVKIREKDKGKNEPEANKIVDDVILTRKKYAEASIGIITMNENQQDLILDKLEDARVDMKGIWVRAINNAQGKEADFVFISIAHYARNDNGSLNLRVSTFNQADGANRLNVLFTRAACHCSIYVSFDYRELKRSDNEQIARLYRYLQYADEGELNTRSSHLSTADERLLEAVCRLTGEANDALEGCTRIGSESVSVDVAVREKDAQSYSLGLLMPSAGQSAAAAVTKMTVLERAGWNLLPLSPTYFLARPEQFAAQLKKSLLTQSVKKEGGASDLLTTRASARRFEVTDLEDQLFSLRPLTADELLALPLNECYAAILNAELFELEDRKLAALARDGSAEASLVSYLRYLPHYAKEGAIDRIVGGLNQLYTARKEQRACLLLASLLRASSMMENPSTERIVSDLLAKARELGIGC